MFKIVKKKGDIPKILSGKGKDEIEKLKKMTIAEILLYEYSSAIYGGKTVKSKLKNIQYDKCCFCESKVSAISHGDVEHFRPKAGWIQAEKDKLTKPGYYWLAFDFSNLYMSCQLCNQVYKKNYFPLKNPAKRAKTHKQNIRVEQTLIIDPAKISPDKHFEFRAEVLHAKTKEGEETIKRTGLNRKELVKQRFEYLEVLRTVAKLAVRKDKEGREAKKQLKELASETKIYSLMVQHNFSSIIGR